MKKTEVLHQPAAIDAYQVTTHQPSAAIKKELTSVQQFTFLGCIISFDEWIDEEVDNQLAKANSSHGRLHKHVCSKSSKTFPFWDVVVISAADEAQSVAFQQQIDEKVKNKQLPLDVQYLCYSDPGSDKIGPGGSLMAVASALRHLFGKTLTKQKILFLPAGGFSQRLPSASMLGKIFMMLPLGDPIYQMIELQLAMYIDLPSRMKSGGLFLACADTFILYDSVDSNPWMFDRPGMTAFAHPSSLEVGRNHGVFVLPSGSLQSETVALVECERFLHKVSTEDMRDAGAVLPKSFTNREIDQILIDSSFFINWSTLAKLTDFYDRVQPLQCEIDSHGDFLQALGTKANSSYITNTQNVVTQSPSLLKMRKDIFEVLCGTPLHALVLKNSKFYHIGTTKEYLHHFCQNDVLRYELGLQHDVCNRFVGGRPRDANKGMRGACVMSSVLPSDIDIAENVILECCQFEGKLSIASDTIISCCSFNNTSNVTLTIPASVFLHTVCITHSDQPRFVTVVFNTGDNLKKSCPLGDIAKLAFLGQRLDGIFTGSPTELTSLFDANAAKCSLWNAKLFQPQKSAEMAFGHALKLVDAVRGQRGSDVSHLFQDGISMKDILEQKNIEGMLSFRRNLMRTIQE